MSFDNFETPDERRERLADAAWHAADDRRRYIEAERQQAIDDAIADRERLEYFARHGDRFNFDNSIWHLQRRGRVVPDVKFGDVADPVSELERRLDLGRVAPFGAEE